jgi:probable addiction module antidote protein
MNTKAGGQKQMPVNADLRSNPDAIATFLNRHFVGAETEKIREALSEALRAQNVSELARSSRIERTTLYRAFGKGHVPSLTKLLELLDALGLELQVRRKQ